MGYLKFPGCNLTNHLSKTSLVNFEFMPILGIMISDRIRIFPCQNAPIITGSYLTYHKLEGLDTPLWDIVGIPYCLTKMLKQFGTYRLIPPSHALTNFRETPLVDAKLHPFSSSQLFYFSLRPRFQFDIFPTNWAVHDHHPQKFSFFAEPTTMTFCGKKNVKKIFLKRFLSR